MKETEFDLEKHLIYTTNGDESITLSISPEGKKILAEKGTTTKTQAELEREQEESKNTLVSMDNICNTMKNSPVFHWSQTVGKELNAQTGEQEKNFSWQGTKIDWMQKIPIHLSLAKIQNIENHTFILISPEMLQILSYLKEFDPSNSFPVPVSGFKCVGSYQHIPVLVNSFAPPQRIFICRADIENWIISNITDGSSIHVSN